MIYHHHLIILYIHFNVQQYQFHSIQQNKNKSNNRFLNKVMRGIYPKNIQNDEKNQNHKFPLIPDEIHKVPDNIRKALKVGKHRKTCKDRNILNNQQLYGTASNLQIFKDRQKITTNLHVRQIFTFVHQKEKNICEPISPVKQNKDSDNQSNLSNKFKGEQLEQLRTSGDRMLYVKKKLSPLKRGLNIEPKSLPNREKRGLKVTFLNIQKLELIKMYQNIDGNRQGKSNSKILSMTSSMITNKNQYTVPNFLESTSFSSKTHIIRKNGYSFDNQSPTKKLKPFQPPFDRYYYRDFIWKIAFNHGIFHESPQKYEKKFKVFIGKGNNSLLIKSLLKRRRAWWGFTEKIEEANFIWTQTKVNFIFGSQKKNQSQYVESIEMENSQKNKNYFNHRTVINNNDYVLWRNYFSKGRRVEDTLDQTMQRRNKYLGREKDLKQLNLRELRIHNHLPNNYIIGNKKALFYTMSQYYQRKQQNVFQYLPLTFHIQNGLEDSQYLKFLNIFYDRAKKIRAKKKILDQSENLDENVDLLIQEKSVKNIWIVKPGQFTNRGNGITVCMSLEEIKKILKKQERHDNGNLKTYIIQSYLQRPFLYQRRKFDIRHYIMMTSINGIIRGYWYEKGYIRTTSFEYSINNSFTSVHLTNDAVQKYLPEYGKYQKGNKVSYEDFQKYLERDYGKKYNFFNDIYPKLKNIATDALNACSLMIDPEKKGNNFEIFGLDFMIDQDFHPWLIQINNNPCLETSCPLLADIVPDMVQNALKICLDPIIPPPAKFMEKRPKFNDNCWTENKFEMVYDSSTEQKYMIQLFDGKISLGLDYKQLQKDQDEVFEDDGIELED